MDQNRRLISCLVSSPLGCIEITATLDGLCSVQFIEKKIIDENDALYFGKKDAATQHLLQAKQEINQYFQGTLAKFNVPLDLQGTAFQLKAWHALCTIPYGQTITYQEQALRLGDPKVIRASANANARNPIAIVVPCHRVIGKNGFLTGYAGGLERKKALIELEKKYTHQHVQSSLLL